MEKLRACPFCGGKAVFRTVNNESDNHSVGFNFKIECEDCGIKLPKTYNISFSLNADGEMNVLNDQRGDAIRMWNMRENDERNFVSREED